VRLQASRRPAEDESTGQIEGVIIGQALYTGAVLLPDAIQMARNSSES
jgi:phosphoribosylformimino-5-aminoimidazole carboxamide ribonucleotide (ProFAR) isomerase